MKFFSFLIFFTLSLNSLFALDVFESYPVADMKNSYQGFKGLLKEDWTQKEPATDEEKMVVEMVRDPKTQGIAKSVLYVQYLRKLVIETATGQSAAPVYSRMLQAALRGAHCGGINVKKKASDQEKAIMKAGAQKVGEVVAPWLLILDPEKRNRFVDKTSGYWAYLTSTTDEAIQRHVNIVTVITKSTAFSAVNLFRDYNDAADPVEDDRARNPDSLRLALDGYRTHRSMALHLPYGKLSGEFNSFIPKDEEVFSLSARTAIGWIALLSVNAEPAIVDEDVLVATAFKAHEERKLIEAGLEKYERIDSKVSELVKKFNNGKDDRPWVSFSPEKKIETIQKVFAALKRKIDLKTLETPKTIKFDLLGFKARLQDHLSMIGKTPLMLDSARDFFAQVLGSEPTTFTIPDALITDLMTFVFQHTNASQSEAEKAIQFGLMVFMPMAAKNPVSYNPILKTIFDYLQSNLGRADDYESEAEALVVLRGFDYQAAYQSLRGKDLEKARIQLLQFLQHSIIQETFPEVKEVAVNRFQQFLNRAWWDGESLAPEVVDVFDVIDFSFPNIQKNKENMITWNNETYAEYKARREKEDGS